MANVNESEINLGLALGISNQRVESCSNTGAGANANSRSRIDTKTIVGHRPLTELVWSKQNGLSVKCAGCSRCFADKKPCVCRDVAPPARDTTDEKRVIEGHARATCHVGSLKSPGIITPGPLLRHTDENIGEVKHVHFIEMEKCSKGKEKESMISSTRIPVGNVVGTSEGPQSQTTADLFPLLANEPESKTKNIGDGTDRLGLDIGLPLKIQYMARKACEERPVPDLAHVKREEDNLKEKGSPSAPLVEKMEETAENDVQDVNVKDVILENLDVERDGRGDLASLSECRMKVQNRDEWYEEDNSHGSMESCNSANLLSKGNKRWRFEEKLIIGSKRIKKQSQECSFSTRVVKQDSSFMNWISSMVKGIKPCQEEEDHSLALSVGHDDQKSLKFVSKRLGFQTVFQSLYSSQDAKRVETRTQVESRSVGNSKDDILNQKLGFGNLWIARLSPKTPPSTLLSSSNSDLKRFAARDSSTDDASVSLKQLCERRSCLFCGEMGHELGGCLQIKEKEMEGFMKNIRLYEGVSKEAPYLSCIKCLQLNHYASACPSNKSEIPKHLASSSGNEGMFDTIRRLRLSRTDILKWMNSCLPISSLDGYFLRLRLAKWEEGVGGAGYYVACITDVNPSKGSKRPIRVNIRGVECLVESPYISNCDFLEDELVAWWQTIKRLPIQEELTSKLEERKRLGF